MSECVHHARNGRMQKPHMLMPLLGTLFSPLGIFAVHVMHTINELNVLTASVNHFQIDSGLWTTRIAEIGSIGGYCAASTPMAQLHHRFRSIRCQTSWKLIHDWIRKLLQKLFPYKMCYLALKRNRDGECVHSWYVVYRTGNKVRNHSDEVAQFSFSPSNSYSLT